MLLKQDKVEAKMAVDGRLDYISKEMSVTIALSISQQCRLIIRRKRIEEQIAGIQKRSEQSKVEVSGCFQFLCT